MWDGWHRVTVDRQTIGWYHGLQAQQVRWQTLRWPTVLLLDVAGCCWMSLDVVAATGSKFTKYTGNHCNDQPHDNGTLVYTNTNAYEGQFKRGVPHGYVPTMTNRV